MGFLLPIGGEGDEPLWRIGRGTRVPLLDAIVGCHCSVPWLGGRVTTNFGGVDAVPLLGAIIMCHCSVLWLGGRVTTESGRGAIAGAIAGCYCNVLWWGEWKTTNFGGMDVVPLQGAIVVCYGCETSFLSWELGTCMDIHVETYMCRPKGLELFGSRDVEKVCECSFLFADCGTSAISQW